MTCCPDPKLAPIQSSPVSQWALAAPLAHWRMETCPGFSAAFIRDDGVRVTLGVDLESSEVPRDEEGEPEGYLVEWRVSFPGPKHAFARVQGTYSPLAILRDVDLDWPMGKRPGDESPR